MVVKVCQHKHGVGAMRQVFLIISGVLMCWTFSEAGPQYPTNLELIEKATRVAVDSIDISGEIPGDSWVRIEINPSSDAGWLVEGVLKERLLSQGIKVTSLQEPSKSVDSLSSLFVLTVRIVEIGVKYEGVQRKYLLFGKHVERSAKVGLQYELTEKPSGTVFLASAARARIADVIPASAIPLVSESKYSFASPTLEKSKLDKYLEGGLVLSIIGVLIYLFYTNKTAS